jgi:hypothetical protein
LIGQNKGFIKRIQLLTAGSDICKEGKFPINHFAVVEGKEEYTDIGDRVPARILAHRPLALEWGEETMAVYDPKINPETSAPTGEFKRIMDRANSGQKNVNAMYGVQFLLWVPSRKDFFTFMCGSKSQRNEIKNFVGKVGQDVALVPKKISTKDYTWFITVLNQCSEKLEDPSPAMLEEVITGFSNPPSEEREAVENVADRG